MVRGGSLVGAGRMGVGAVLGLAVSLLAIAVGAAGASAEGTPYLSQDFASQGTVFGPLLSETPEKCEPQETTDGKEPCHWTRTQGADVAGQAFPVEFAPEASVHSDEEGKTNPFNDPEYNKELAAHNYWHIQKNAQTIEILGYVQKHLIKLGPEESAKLPAAPPEDTEPAEYANKHELWEPRYPWFGEGNEKGKAGESAGATGTYCGLEAEIMANNEEAGPEGPKDGCKSSGAPPEGELVSPPFSLVGASTAYLHFKTWWEIEAETPTERDLMAVDYSTDNGKSWQPAALLNPGENQIGSGSAYEPFSNMGLQRAPEWAEDVVDLQSAIGYKEVEVRFRFDARDTSYNGYRGWAIDNVDLTSTAPPAPTITSCSIGASTTPVLEGSGFLLGSTVMIGSSSHTTLAQSATRIELRSLGESFGTRTVQVLGPAGTANSAAVTVTVTGGTCAVLTSETTSTTTTTTSTQNTTSTTNSTAYPTTPPKEVGHPVVDKRNGEIEAEFEFPEPGRANFTAVVSQGASLSRVEPAGIASLANPLAALEGIAGPRAAGAKAAKCRKGYVRKNGKCVDDAPVGYGHASTKITKAGRYRVIITPSTKALKALRKGKTLDVRLTLTFVPAGTAIDLVDATNVTVHLKPKH